MPVRRGGQDEQGAVVVMTAVLMVVLLGFAAFAVDLGMQRVARRDMQSLADVVALDLARLVDGRTAGAIVNGTPDSGIASLETARSASLERNRRTTVGDSPVVTVRLVQVDPVSGEPIPQPGGGFAVPASVVPDGVLVTATTTVDFGFAQVLGAEDGGASRSAVAASEATGCFKLGSWLARGTTPDGVDAGVAVDLLGAQVDAALGLSDLPGASVTALGYEGLADATVSVLDLLEASPTAGTVEELLDASLTVQQLLELTAEALTANGTVADAQVLTGLSALSSSTVWSTALRLGDLVVASTGAGSALATGLNVLDLVTAAILLASGDTFATVDLPVTLPGVGELTAHLDVVRPPQQACGPIGTTAHTAQTTLTLAGGLTTPARLTAQPLDLGLDVDLLGSLLAVGARIDAPVDLLAGTPALEMVIEAASADGTLRALTCARGTSDSPDTMTVATTSALVGVDLRVPVVVDSTLELVLDVVVLGAPREARVSVHLEGEYVLAVGTDGATPDGGRLLKLPPNDRTPVSVAAGLGLSGTTVAPVEVTPLSLSTTVHAGSLSALGVTQAGLELALRPVLDPLVEAAVSDLLDPTLTSVDSLLDTTVPKLLGINTAGVDVFGVPRPDCSAPALRH